MLDFIYTGVPPTGTTTIGADVFRATTGSPNGCSVVYRRDLLARRIDEVARSIVRPKILSLACGHLREAQQAQAVKAGRIGEFFALDHDAQSLAVVEHEQARYGITPVHASIGALMRGKLCFRDLHFIYAAGLFDYLSDDFSTKLLSVMFNMLVPGGRLLLGNFTPDNHGRGYMECFMDWRLICRNEAKMATLIKEINDAQVAAQSLYRDCYGSVVYLELRKKS
jgi:SAM-dependent methyltransferase